MSKKDSGVLEPPVKHHGSQVRQVAQEESEPPQHEPQHEETESPLIVTPAAPVVTPFVGSLPPLLGKAPTSVAQMQRNIPGTKGSHFTGPVVSGPSPGAPYPFTAGQNPQVSGTGACALALLLDYTMGNFSIPIAFPQGSFIYSWLSVCFAPFATGPVAFTMGTTSGATDIVSGGSFGAALGELDQNITGSLPLWNATSPQVPFQGWLNVTGNTGGPAGQGLIVLFFIRLALPWS
jgi:hypothetical protein